MQRLSNVFSRFREYDVSLLLYVFLLLAISFASLYSIDLSQGTTLTFFRTQFIAFSIGCVVLCVAGSMHITWFRSAAGLTYLFSVILLVAVLFLGSTIRGTTGWFRMFGYSFQPAEFAKAALILAMAVLAERHGRLSGYPFFFITSGVITLILVSLIMKQPDLGTGLVFGAVWYGILCVIEKRKIYPVAVALLFVSTAVFGWFFFFQDYQKERLMTFVYPERDPLGAGYNVAQSIIAVGSGQLLGRGLARGTQSQLHFLPEAQTDFIISVIAEELGFLGVTAVLVVYFLLLRRLLIIARRANNDFVAYLVLGMAFLFITQLVLNMGGATGIIPVTGVTLPFLSYGGSSLIINMLLIGIAESAARSPYSA